MRTTPRGRSQVRLQIAREAGRVRELVIQRVPSEPGAARLETVLRLNREDSARLIDLVRSLDYIEPEGGETTRVDDSLLHEIFADPDALSRLYHRDPATFRELIRTDSSAEDLIAVEHRRKTVTQFRELLHDSSRFEQAAQEAGGKKEKVWQDLLEQNPWILGISLAGQLLTSWDDAKLEQVVAGYSVAGSGKRADALLRTNGRIRSLVFAEIKRHDTPLLGSEYRPESWTVSSEVVGGIVQLQQTVQAAARKIGERLADEDVEGADTGEDTFLLQPRSFLIVGHLDQLRGPAGGVHRAKYRSFELFRRNVTAPEIITFDELLARAEWHVSLAAQGEARPSPRER